jgi:hypothetical protein
LGITFKKSPPISANATLILNPIIYGLCAYFLNDEDRYSFLDRIFYTTSILAFVYLVLHFIYKLDKPPAIPERNHEIKFERNLAVIIWSIFIFAGISALYLIFI